MTWLSFHFPVKVVLAPLGPLRLTYGILIPSSPPLCTLHSELGPCLTDRQTSKRANSDTSETVSLTTVTFGTTVPSLKHGKTRKLNTPKLVQMVTMTR